MTRILLFSLLLGFACVAFAMNASERFAKVPWSCFGILEITNNKDSQSMVRAIPYPNGEYAFEIVGAPGIKKRLHIFQPVRKSFYLGVKLSDIEGGSNNPFMFIDMLLGIPITVLQGAFPTGVSSVPGGISQRDVNVPIEHKDDRFTLKTEKNGVNQVRYWITSSKSDMPKIVGLWDGANQEPLADDFSLIDWVHVGNGHVRTAGEARALDSNKQ